MAEQNDPLKTRLSELRKSISEMSDDELYAAIGTSRNNRRQPPAKASPKKKSTSKKAKKEDSIEAMIASLTPEQAAALYKQLSDES